jgi:hypothetical protein
MRACMFLFYHNIQANEISFVTCLYKTFFRLHIAEPQTKLSPKLKDSKIKQKEEIIAENSAVALLCSAQASPVPVFRLVQRLKISG